MDEQTRTLAYGLRRWLQLLEGGNLRGAIVEGSAWFHELRAYMERNGVENVPEELRWAEREKRALVEAIDQGRISARDAGLLREYIEAMKR